MVEFVLVAIDTAFQITFSLAFNGTLSSAEHDTGVAEFIPAHLQFQFKVGKLGFGAQKTVGAGAIGAEYRAIVYPESGIAAHCIPTVQRVAVKQRHKARFRAIIAAKPRLPAGKNGKQQHKQDDQKSRHSHFSKLA